MNTIRGDTDNSVTKVFTGSGWKYQKRLKDNELNRQNELDTRGGGGEGIIIKRRW